MKNIFFIIIFLGFCSQIFAQTYTFNAKATFKMETSDGTFSSYFYLNTQNGNAGHDTQAWQLMTNENVEGYIFSVVEYEKKMSQYMNVEGRKYVVEQPISREKYTADMFWKEFKKTGKQQTFGKYKADEYIGTSEGRQLSMWLGEKTYNLDGILQGDIVGSYGVGYLYKPSEKAYYLIVHFVDEEAQITLLDITPFSKTVTLSGFEKITTTMPIITNPDQEEPELDDLMTGQTYGMEYFKCSTIYEMAVTSAEQSLPALKELLNGNQINAQQKAEIRKEVACLERKLPAMKQAKNEALRAEQLYAGNQEKLFEECQKIGEKLEKSMEDCD